MEYWDLYDINRIKLDKTIKRGERCPKGCYRILVHVALFNTEGKMLIQHRHPDKTIAPDKWDISVGGSCIAGETSQEAAMRETFEEVGYKVDLNGIRPNLTIHAFDCFNDIYLVDNICSDDFHIGEDEVIEIKWATIEEIKELIDNKLFVPYHKNYIDLIFHLRNHPGVHKID